MIFMLCVAGIYLCSMFFLLLRLVIGLIHIVVVSSHLMSCSIIPEDFKSAGHFPSPDSVKSRFKAIFNKWPSWIRSCCFSWIFALGNKLNHEAYNVRTIVFMISENTIPYIGTEILLLTKNDHNSTQKAPKSIIPEDFKSAGHFPSSNVKSRFKAISKSDLLGFAGAVFAWNFAPGGRHTRTTKTWK